jgi:hypothetical protein
MPEILGRTKLYCINLINFYRIENSKNKTQNNELKALLSHRYGARCLPTRIVADEYTKLLNEIKSHEDDYDLSFVYTNQKKRENDEKEDEAANDNEETKKEVSVDMDVTNLLEHCYELDENEIPARFKLKHLDKIFNNYNPKVLKLYFSYG